MEYRNSVWWAKYVRDENKLRKIQNKTGYLMTK